MAEKEGYWYESAVQQTSRNFFEDESSATKMCGVSLGGTAKLSQQIKAGLGGIGTDRYSVDSLSGSISGLVLKGDEEKVELELHQLIPERTLQKILDADNEDFSFLTHSLTTEKEELRMLRRYYESRWSPPEIDSVVTASLLGRPYSLEHYKSLKHKKELLKAAEMMGDGDLILNVILFLSRTLKKKLFHDILGASPVAVQHYTNYLTTVKQISVLTDTLEMLGKSRDAAMKLYFEACTNPQRMLQRLRVCSRNHFTETKDRIVLDSFIRLLEWQETYDGGKLLGASVATCLSDICLNHWELPKTSPHCPAAFCQNQVVSDRLYQWAALIARGKRQAWADIDGIFLTKGWLGGKKAKTDLPMEEVVSCMSRLGAPQTLLSSYLEFVDNLDKRLSLAKKLQCHRSAIDTYIALKDRLSLLSYKANLVPQSEDYIYAEQSLRNPAIRWKN
uniref:Spermatogenesis-defective protein 39 n=1 Tax=Lygus hesperus TaxID=30085 RepID=A0A0A9ZDE8_LYGHE